MAGLCSRERERKLMTRECVISTNANCCYSEKSLIRSAVLQPADERSPSWLR